MLTENSYISTKKFFFLLILAVFLEAAGYTAFPFLTVRLRDQFGLSTKETGSVLLLAFWLRPAASLVLGTYFSKVSASKLSFLSCLFEAIAFFGLAISTNTYVGVLSLILGNIGLALWKPGLFGSIYNDKTHPKRSQRISLLNGALNGGLVLGCLLGALLVKFDTTWAFLFSGAIYALLAMPIFFEVLVNGENIYTVELAARPGGGMIPYLYMLASTLNYPKILGDIMTGKTQLIDFSSISESYAVFFPFASNIRPDELQNEASALGCKVVAQDYDPHKRSKDLSVRFGQIIFKGDYSQLITLLENLSWKCKHVV